jgi:hypothetical protein
MKSKKGNPNQERNNNIPLRRERSKGCFTEIFKRRNYTFHSIGYIDGARSGVRMKVWPSLTLAICYYSGSWEIKEIKEIKEIREIKGPRVLGEASPISSISLYQYSGKILLTKLCGKKNY